MRNREFTPIEKDPRHDELENEKFSERIMKTELEEFQTPIRHCDGVW